MSLDYFSALLRSAGIAPSNPRAPLHSAPATADPFDPFDPSDPFEAFETREAVDASPRADAPPRAGSPSPSDGRHALMAAAHPLPLTKALPAALASDAHPNVQAALRWVAAGAAGAGSAGAAGATDAAAEAEAAAPSAPRATDPAASQATSRQGAAMRLHPQRRDGQPQRTSQAAHAQRSASGQTRPEPAAEVPAGPSIDAQAARTEPVAGPRPPPRSPAQVVAAPREPPRHPGRVAPSEGSEVHIGTLHVTVDPAATARFAPRTLTAEAPQASRANAARPDARPGPDRPGAGSSLSRSRLPRW